jgi:hypothetical protein
VEPGAWTLGPEPWGLDPEAWGLILSSADEIHDLDLIALVDRRRVERLALQHHQVEFNGDTAGVDLEV